MKIAVYAPSPAVALFARLSAFAANVELVQGKVLINRGERDHFFCPSSAKRRCVGCGHQRRSSLRRCSCQFGPILFQSAQTQLLHASEPIICKRLLEEVCLSGKTDGARAPAAPADATLRGLHPPVRATLEQQAPLVLFTESPLM